MVQLVVVLAVQLEKLVVGVVDEVEASAARIKQPAMKPIIVNM